MSIYRRISPWPLVVLCALFLPPAAAADRRTPAASPGAGKSPGGKAPRIEVAFVLDATGSMGPYIEEARRRIVEIAEDLATGDPSPEVRFALVAYRDRSDDFVTRVDPFSGDIEVMKGNLTRTEARGGGDTPEAVLQGLHAAITELDWSVGDARVLKLAYLVGDAPDKDYADVPSAHQVAAAARQRGIVVHSIACGHMMESGRETFSEVSRLTEGRPMLLTSSGPRRRTAGAADADARTTGGLAAAVTGTTRAYSKSVGVDYESSSATPVSSSELSAPAVPKSGLLGSQVRWIRDPLAWSDLWAAHTSLMTEPPPSPEIDFSRYCVLALGGQGGGLAVDAVTSDGERRAAHIRPVDGGGVRFVLVALDVDGGER